MNRREFTGTVLGAFGALALPFDLEGSPRLRVNGKRVMEQLFALGEFGKNPEGGVSRVAYSEADRQGREYVLGLMRAAGLDVSVDPAGNLIGRRAGRRDLPSIAFGSHIDSVPKGGNYDGPVGSLAAVEVAHALREQNIRTRHPLEVIIFQNEEGGLYGSRALSGEIPARELELTSHSGKTVREGIRFIGGDPDRLAEARRRPGDLAAFLELHIEQGGVLEAERVDIGVVQGIVGIGWWDVTWEGLANHAGTTPMDQRQDALLAAARLVDAVHRVARATPGRHVATVGRIRAEPGAPNVVPGRVVNSLEIRDLEESKMRSLFERIRREAETIAEGTGTRVSFEELNWLKPAPADPRVQAAVASAAGELGLSHRTMPSGAGHDTQSMARLAPAGMIFIPSVGGISHSPKEFSHPEDVEKGANVLLHTLLTLDRTLGR
jgi:N-carbamoyl-L-amino-acid hydrolase